MRKYLGVVLLSLVCLGCSESPPAAKPAPNTPAPGGAEKPLGDVGRSGDAALASYRGKNPVFIVMGDNRDAFLQKLTAADADLQSKNVVVVEVFDLSSASPKAQVWKGSSIPDQDAQGLVDMYGSGPTGTKIVVLDKEGKVAHRADGSVEIAELLSKLPE